MPSENGWEPGWVDADRLSWVDIPGAPVWLQFQQGWPLAILRAFAADFHAYVEPLRNADSASYTATNSVSTSNHLNGTAMDLNWDSHPFHAKGTFTSGQMATIRELLEFYEGTMFWAGDWASPIDEMHWQLGYNTYGDPRLGDFIARKIRADGFSTFGRSQEAPNGGAAILSEATGLALARAEEILPSVQHGLHLSECTNVARIAMWLAQVGHESDNFNATEEYASGAAYEGRIELGNTQEGDGVRFKGRSWGQVTGRFNYGQFSQWCFANGLANEADYFVKHPERLADMEWAGVGPAWYWTVARADINDFADRKDIETVTRKVNGGLNGFDDRVARFNRALALGDRLLGILTAGDDELANPEIEKMIREVHAALFNSVASQSIYRTPGEGRRWQLHELIRNGDGMLHQFDVEFQAKSGDWGELHRVVLTASGRGAVQERWAIERAKRVLAEIEADDPAVMEDYIRGMNE